VVAASVGTVSCRAVVIGRDRLAEVTAASDLEALNIALT